MDSEEAYRDTLNSGASFLVAPHNLRFEKRVQKATNKIRDGVKDSIQYIMGKHDKAEAKRLYGLPPEIVKVKKGKKPQEIERTEAFRDLVDKNIPGQSVNGRKMNQPSVSLYAKLKKRIQ